MNTSRQIILIAHNVRSAHNVGALLRTAEGLGVSKVLLTGYTPYPQHAADTRLPHESRKIHAQISKTALGAEVTTAWSQASGISEVIAGLTKEGFQVYALEQAPDAISLSEFKAPDKVALVVGREVEGVEQEVLDQCHGVLEIPMYGKKESFNVAQAAAMALYHMTFF